MWPRATYSAFWTTNRFYTIISSRYFWKIRWNCVFKNDNRNFPKSWPLYDFLAKIVVLNSPALGSQWIHKIIPSGLHTNKEEVDIPSMKPSQLPLGNLWRDYRSFRFVSSLFYLFFFKKNFFVLHTNPSSPSLPPSSCSSPHHQSTPERG